MANFKKAYVKLANAEFGSNPEKFLHKNQGENGYTIGGIYQVANPNSFNWEFIEKTLALCNSDYGRASKMLYADDLVRESVEAFFKRYYWDKALLDEIHGQVVAENIFLSGVHIGMKNAIKLAQKVAQTKQDGVIGQYTIKALNNGYDENYFKKEFDKLELSNYNNLIERNPNLAWARNGFMTRVYAV